MNQNNNNNMNDGLLRNFTNYPAKIKNTDYTVIEVPTNKKNYVWEDSASGKIFRLLPGIEDVLMGTLPITPALQKKREQFIRDVTLALKQLGLKLKSAPEFEDYTYRDQLPSTGITFTLERNEYFEDPSYWEHASKSPYGAWFTPELEVQFFFQKYSPPKGNNEPQYGDYFGPSIFLMHFNDEVIPTVLEALDYVLVRYYNVKPSQTNIKKGFIEREWQKKVLGDPYFAKYFTKFLSKNNLKENKSGGSRKTRKSKKIRKQKTARK